MGGVCETLSSGQDMATALTISQQLRKTYLRLGRSTFLLDEDGAHEAPPLPVLAVKFLGKEVFLGCVAISKVLMLQ